MISFVGILTLQCGQRLLITVHYDGLLSRRGSTLTSGMILTVESLHVKLQMAIAVKPKTLSTGNSDINLTAHQDNYADLCYSYAALTSFG